LPSETNDRTQSCIKTLKLGKVVSSEQQMTYTPMTHSSKIMFAQSPCQLPQSLSTAAQSTQQQVSSQSPNKNHSSKSTFIEHIQPAPRKFKVKRLRPMPTGPHPLLEAGAAPTKLESPLREPAIKSMNSKQFQTKSSPINNQLRV
jgi:hypothetical protein